MTNLDIFKKIKDKYEAEYDCDYDVEYGFHCVSRSMYDILEDEYYFLNHETYCEIEGMIHKCNNNY
jgi:hypothetical protein